MSIHDPWVQFVLCFFFVCLYGAWKAKRESPLHDLPGPPSESFLLGNLRQIMREQVGYYDVKLQDTYGMVARIKAPLGGDRLWVSDPKAIQYILQTSRDILKPYAALFALNTATARGVSGAEGQDHYRQRRILLPAFGHSESRSQLPVFRQCARELVQEFRNHAESLGNGVREENIPEFLSSGVLNALGLAAFNYDFRDDGENRAEFAASLRDIMAKGFGLPSDWKVFCQGIMVHVTPWLLDLMIYFPSPGLAFLRRHVQMADDIARRLIQSRLLEGDDVEKKDALSRIVIANRSETERWRLTDDELAPQLCTLLGAAHETTVTALGWILFELATHPDEQCRLREEINSVQAADHVDDIKTVNFDALPFLNAVIKETLRFDTVIPHLFRVTTSDEVIPLSKQVHCRSGSVTKELYVPKGTHIIISDVAYSKNRDIWGEDADVWRPSRWLDGSIKSSGVNVGVWSNLLSFGNGYRTCIGWQFAVAEMQAFVFELISRLKFEATEKTARIRRENCLVMLPMVEDELQKGNQLPLGVSIVNDSE